MTASEPPSILEDFESCPMCGYEGITSGGRCVNCGEPLIEGADQEESKRPADSLLNWRFLSGVLLFLSFGTFSVIVFVKSRDLFDRDRTLYVLIAVALGCVALIGLSLLVRGIMAAIPPAGQADE